MNSKLFCASTLDSIRQLRQLRVAVARRTVVLLWMGNPASLPFVFHSTLSFDIIGISMKRDSFENNPEALDHYPHLNRFLTQEINNATCIELQANNEQDGAGDSHSTKSEIKISRMGKSFACMRRRNCTTFQGSASVQFCCPAVYKYFLILDNRQRV